MKKGVSKKPKLKKVVDKEVTVIAKGEKPKAITAYQKRMYKDKAK